MRNLDRPTGSTTVSQLADELRTLPRGSLLVLEGQPEHRVQLAQALAGHLGYRMNLDAVVSKHIGETEKNLDRIFSAANNPASLLFFDEADALFGSRTDVKDSHDRYANLTRRLSAFQGIVVIGTGSRYDVPSHHFPGSKVIAVHEHWPPR